MIQRIITPKMTAIGENVFSNLDFGGIVKLRRLFFVCLPATADLAVTTVSTVALNAYTAITRCRLKVADLPVWDATKEAVNFALANADRTRCRAPNTARSSRSISATMRGLPGQAQTSSARRGSM